MRERETGTACLQFVCQSVCLSVCLSGCLGINACPAKARKIERNITRVLERERKDVLVSPASLKLFNSLQQQQQKGKKWCKIELSKKLQCKIIIEKNYQQQTTNRIKKCGTALDYKHKYTATINRVSSCYLCKWITICMD